MKAGNAHGFAVEFAAPQRKSGAGNALISVSLIMTLHDVGFDNHEIETYMNLLLAGESTEEQRLRILNEKRNTALDEIHFKEAQLDRLDYLRHKIQMAKKESISGSKTDKSEIFSYLPGEVCTTQVSWRYGI